MSHDALAQRQRQSATAILTLIAFQFVASYDLPRVAYLTLIDKIFVWSLLCISITLVTNVLHKRRYRLDEQRGVNSDRMFRWLFPAIYAAGMILFFLVRLVLSV